MANWKQPQGMRLAKHLEAVVDELRRCAPVLFEAHVRALEGMATTARLASQPRRLSAPQPCDRGDHHV